MKNYIVEEEEEEEDNILIIEVERLLKLCDPESPFQILQVNWDTPRSQIIKNYDRLLSESQDSDDRDQIKIKLDSAFKILADDSYRSLFDGLLAEFEEQHARIEREGANSKLNKLYVASLTLSILSWPVSKVASIVNSSKSIIKSSDVVKQIYQQRGVKGFYSGSTLIYMVSIGAVNSVVNNLIYSIINPRKLPSPLFKVLDTIIPATAKHPQSLLLDLINIAPLSLSIIEIIKNIILRKGTGNGLQWKNLFFGLGTGIMVWSSKTLLDYIFNNIKSAYYRNPNSKLFKFLNDWLIDNIFIRSSIITMLILPIEIIRIQNSRILLEGYLNQKSNIVSMYPIPIVLDLYKSSGIKRFISGFISQYLVVLVEELSATVDMKMFQLDQELLRDEDVY